MFDIYKKMLNNLNTNILIDKFVINGIYNSLSTLDVSNIMKLKKNIDALTNINDEILQDGPKNSNLLIFLDNIMLLDELNVSGIYISDIIVDSIINYLILNTNDLYTDEVVNVPLCFLLFKVFNVYKEFMPSKSVRLNLNKIMKALEISNCTINKISDLSNYSFKKKWVLEITYLERLQIIQKWYKKKNNRYINKVPEDWMFFDNKTVTKESYTNLITTPKDVLRNHIYSYANERFVKDINTLQKQSYYINKVLFGIALNLSSNWLETIINNKKDFMFDNTMLRSHYHTVLKEYLLQKNIGSKHSHTLKYILEIKKCLEVKIDNINESVLSTNKLLVLIDILILDKDDRIYHNIYCCYRTRMYHKDLLSYIGSKLYRLLVDLRTKKEKLWNDSNDLLNVCNTSKYYISKLYYPSIKSFEQAAHLYEECVSSLSKTDALVEKFNINKLKIALYGENATVWLDATSSMLQVISLLTKNKKLMQYSNVLPHNKEQYDIYSILCNLLLEEHAQSVFIDYLTNRKLIKYACMTYLYGSSALYIARVLINDKKVNDITITDLTYVVNTIISTFNKEFKVVLLIKNFFKQYQSVLPKNRPISYKIHGKQISYTAPKKQKTRILMDSHNTNQKYSVSFNTFTKKIDYEKAKKSFFVNIIHSLDAYVCIKTRTLLKKKYKVKCLSVHDSFGVLLKNYETCLLAYNTSISSILELSILDILDIKTDFAQEDLLHPLNISNITESFNKHLKNVYTSEYQEEILLLCITKLLYGNNYKLLSSKYYIRFEESEIYSILLIRKVHFGIIKINKYMNKMKKKSAISLLSLKIARKQLQSLMLKLMSDTILVNKIIDAFVQTNAYKLSIKYLDIFNEGVYTSDAKTVLKCNYSLKPE